MRYKNWEDFMVEWEAIEHPDPNCEWMYQFEYTTEEERELIKKVSEGDSKRIWTLVHSDGDRDLELIVPGYHLVNRMSYIITKKPRTLKEHENLSYLYWDHDNECSEDLGGDDE